MVPPCIAPSRDHTTRDPVTVPPPTDHWQSEAGWDTQGQWPINPRIQHSNPSDVRPKHKYTWYLALEITAITCMCHLMLWVRLFLHDWHMWQYVSGAWDSACLDGRHCDVFGGIRSPRLISVLCVCVCVCYVCEYHCRANIAYKVWGTYVSQFHTLKSWVWLLDWTQDWQICW